jgi:hypothetical protein
LAFPLSQEVVTVAVSLSGEVTFRTGGVHSAITDTLSDFPVEPRESQADTQTL